MKRFFVLVVVLMLIAPLVQAQEQVLYSLFSSAEQMDGWFGSAVALAGDVDNDGCVDVAVGAPGEDHIPDPSYVDVGHIHIFSGATGEKIHRLECPYWGSDSGTGFGIPFSCVGDVNGDGHDDILAGAPQAEGNYGWWDGRSSVFSGATGDVLYNLVSPTEQQIGLFGVSVARLDDIDADECDDFAIGALFEWNAYGQVHVFSGSTGSYLRTLQSPNPEEDSQFGHSVAGISDVNGNSSPEVVVGSPLRDVGAVDDAGRVYVFDSVTSTVIHTLNSPNPDDSGYFGWVVSCAGDANDDGYDDIAVGAWGENPGSSADDAGRAYVFDGFTGDLLYTLSSPDEEADSRFGKSISTAGDVNDDGYDDILVGACREDPDAGPVDAGRAYVFCGQTGDLLLTLRSPNEETGGHFGHGVAGGEDLDGDGYVDLVVGAPHEDSESRLDDAGRAYVFTTAFILSGAISGSNLMLEWTACPGVDAYWLYGANNMPFFEPGITPPYEHRVQVFGQHIQMAGLGLGIGNTASNWSYIMVGIDTSEQEIRRSNRFGEHDYGIDIP